MWNSRMDDSEIFLTCVQSGEDERKWLRTHGRERVVAQQFTDVTFLELYFQSSLAVP